FPYLLAVASVLPGGGRLIAHGEVSSPDWGLCLRSSEIAGRQCSVWEEHRLKNLLAAALGATTLVIGATAAAADPVQWTLPDLTLVDGGTISGTFTYDSDTATFSKIQVNTSGGALAGV